MKTDQEIVDIAKVCHEANRSYCYTHQDLSQLSWEAAPEWQRQSAINGVRFNLENPEAPASSSHDNWLKEKVADGWFYAEVKNAEKKEHPCMVPYEQLPDFQKKKDALFKAIVGALS